MEDLTENKLDAKESTKNDFETILDGLETNSIRIDDKKYIFNKYCESFIQENEHFYFESDTLALRNNSDYSCLLKTLVLLENQRIQTLNDLEILHYLKEKSLNDPFKFIKELANKDTSNNKLLSLQNSQYSIEKIPTRQKVFVIPEVDWNKYFENIDLEDLESIKKQKEIRVHSLRQTSKLIQNHDKSPPTNKSLTRNIEIDPREEKANYNKPWSVEEQRN